MTSSARKSDGVAKVRSEPEVHICATCSRQGATCGTGGQWYCGVCVDAVDPDYWAPESREAVTS